MGLRHPVASLLYTVWARIGVVHTHDSLSIICLEIQIQDLVANLHHVSKIYCQRSSLRFAGSPSSTCSVLLLPVDRALIETAEMLQIEWGNPFRKNTLRQNSAINEPTLCARTRARERERMRETVFTFCFVWDQSKSEHAETDIGLSSRNQCECCEEMRSWGDEVKALWWARVLLTTLTRPNWWADSEQGSCCFTWFTLLLYLVHIAAWFNVNQVNKAIKACSFANKASSSSNIKPQIILLNTKKGLNQPRLNYLIRDPILFVGGPWRETTHFVRVRGRVVNTTLYHSTVVLFTHTVHPNETSNLFDFERINRDTDT